ncbi:polyprenol phosphomannose-dependent alpha 1,6 mannosyltransferase MptB [Nostocoides sp. HKS02]|uniref:polyprenol phosphomannose-dependent alpha 1,6 mannosyltransferase MptB n=1 Tax=Nostocoides sp. HKS02 TaxID=1813880 RepID=UPI00210629C8|nr:polyprenol phosphomannose-dependent alpha 1,6 mannosyltransferase MptB [Tetrasphaera sp. HKS02]
MVLARFAAAVSGGSLLVALGLLRLGATASVLVLAWAVPVIARRLGTDPVRAVWLGFLTPLVGMHLVAGAHNDALMIAAMVAAVALALQGRHGWACLAIAAAMAVKAPAAVAMPFVAILAAVDHRGSMTHPGMPTLGMPLGMRRLALRTVVAGAASCVAFVVISLVTGLGFSWVNSLSEPGKSIQWTSLPTGIGMGIGFVGTLFGHNVEDGAVSVARTVALVALGIALVWIWVRALRRAQDRRFVVVCAGQALVAFIVLSPAFHAWYLLWALPLFAASVTDRRWQTVLAGLATLMAVSILPGGYSLGLVTSWVGVPLCFVALGAGVVYGWRWIQAQRSRVSARHTV